MPIGGIMCHSRSGRPMCAKTNMNTISTALMASISPSTVTLCMPSWW
jgi:hypothetical protein